MLHQKQLGFMDKRLRQIKGNNTPFGGIIMVLIGDTGQLPAVLGRVLWDQTPTTNEYDSHGRFLYFNYFKTVIHLTENKRIVNNPEAIYYDQFLTRLRDGECTYDDFQTIRTRCSRNSMTRTEWQERGFTGDNVVRLFTTNKEVNKENEKRLKALNKPIVRIDAENSNSNAKKTSSERFHGLRNVLYLAVSAKVVLESNICPEVGLANGSTGTIKDIVYDDDKLAPNLPAYCWVEMDDYSGPTFFQNSPERRKWVPIAPISVTDSSKKDGNTRVQLTRTMLPLRCAWAWTIWKAQGQTILGKVILVLGSKEKEHGLTYVGFSRTRRLEDVGLDGGISLDRITTKIKDQKKLKVRLREDRRLDALERETLAMLNGAEEG
jgi:ATP-dependent DNA helicase PIF1